VFIGIIVVVMTALVLVLIKSMFKNQESKIDSKFKDMDGKFNAIDIRFKALETRMDDKFEAGDIRFNAVENRIGGVETRLTEVGTKLEVLTETVATVRVEVGKLQDTVYGRPASREDMELPQTSDDSSAGGRMSRSPLAAAGHSETDT
jgi:hypothetical protein